MTEVAVAPQETGPLSPEQQQQQNGDNNTEGLLAGKFKTQEELEKGYLELQRMVGQRGDKEAPDSSGDQGDQGNGDGPDNKDGKDDDEDRGEGVYGEAVDTALRSAGLEPRTVANEYAENKSLSDQTYADLAKAGYDRDVVDSYIRGFEAEQQAAAEESASAADLRESEVKEIHSSVGGETQFRQMMAWAGENFTPEEKAAFDNTLDKGDLSAIKLAVDGIHSRYKNSEGYEPPLNRGGQGGPGVQPYTHVDQITKAVSDPRYGKDAEYMRNHMQRLQASSVLG